MKTVRVWQEAVCGRRGAPLLVDGPQLLLPLQREKEVGAEVPQHGGDAGAVKERLHGVMALWNQSHLIDWHHHQLASSQGSQECEWHCAARRVTQ